MKAFAPVFPLLASLATLALGINFCQGDKSIAGYCNTTSFTDRTTSVSGPPTTSQCQDACRGVLTDAGDWIVDFTGKPAGYIDTMVGYPCAFKVARSASEPANYKFFMDNQDIVDIIDEVSNRYGGLHGGKVAAQGTMVCQGHEAVWYVN